MGDTGTEKAAETLRGLQVSASINGGIGVGVNASNTRMYGSQEQIIEGKDINELKSSYENVMKQLSTSEKNDEITGLARERSAAIQKVNSLNSEKTVAENELKQAEIGFQRMKQSAVTFDENITEAVNDRIAKTNTEITQGKQEVQTKGEAVKQKVQERGNRGAFREAKKELGRVILGDEDDK